VVPRWCVFAGLALTLSACGGDARKLPTTPPPPKEATSAAKPSPTRDPASAEDVAVIKAWSDQLRRGHVKAAARYFALPAIVSNGTGPLKLTKRAHVEFFNRALPCGARFKEAVDTGAFVVATLVLTERPGRGKCGSGVGNEVYTAFLIRRDKIVQWRRVLKPAPLEEEAPAGDES
jgi:hypothetical protein